MSWQSDLKTCRHGKLLLSLIRVCVVGPEIWTPVGASVEILGVFSGPAAHACPAQLGLPLCVSTLDSVSRASSHAITT